MSIGDGIVILGATSTIGADIGRRLAVPGRTMVLVARNGRELEPIAGELASRGAEVRCLERDLADFSIHEELVATLTEWLGGRLHTVLLCYGALGDQRSEERDVAALRRQIDLNLTSALSLLSLIASELEPRGAGQIVAISSVAGERGRAGNYIYGAAKAGLTVFLSGLRQRLSKSGVGVLTVLPGFVATKMTRHLPQGVLFARSDDVAASVVRAMERDRHVIRTPWFWTPIMLIVRSIPESLFIRLRF